MSKNVEKCKLKQNDKAKVNLEMKTTLKLNPKANDKNFCNY